MRSLVEGERQRGYKEPRRGKLAPQDHTTTDNDAHRAAFLI